VFVPKLVGEFQTNTCYVFVKLNEKPTENETVALLGFHKIKLHKAKKPLIFLVFFLFPRQVLQYRRQPKNGQLTTGTADGDTPRLYRKVRIGNISWIGAEEIGMASIGDETGMVKERGF
jgi:hypothetical protein